MIAQSSQTPPLLIIPQATCKVRGARDWPGDDALIYFPMANGQVLPVRDAIEGRVTGLIGRDDKALFTGHTGTAVSLRINVRNPSLFVLLGLILIPVACTHATMEPSSMHSFRVPSGYDADHHETL